MTVVRAAFGVLPVPLDGAGYIGHLGPQWLSGDEEKCLEFGARSIFPWLTCQAVGLEWGSRQRLSILVGGLSRVMVITWTRQEA